jgi:VIT1/CCC1 family predicted Fe2+/Mn2+ transporter
MMKHSIKMGFSFGLTSGIITTLGLMVGLHSGTHSRLAVLGGILTIAIADAFSDALGIHISEESENKHTPREIWESTLSTVVSKFGFALTFIVPVIFWELSTAIIVSIIWGLAILCIFSFMMAKEQKSKPWGAVLEHLVIALVVIVTTHFVGHLVSTLGLSE